MALLPAAIPFLIFIPAIAHENMAPVRSTVLEEMTRHGKATYWVVLKEQADLSGASRIADWAARGRYVYDALTTVAARSQAGVASHLKARALPHKSFWILNAIRVTSGPDDLDRIRRRKEVGEIQDDPVFTIPEPRPGAELATIDDVEWNIARINAPQVWSAFGVRGEGIVIANIDTGVQFDHPALVARYRGNLGAAGFDHSYNWFDPSRVCAAPHGVPCDNMGHGTHTMGTMIGDDGGANRIGVAPRARWIAAKGCESDGCSAAALTASAQWILAPTDLDGENPRPDLRPHVVNNSWGGQGGRLFFQEFVRAWVAAGIFPAFSNGNAGPDCGTSGSPGDYPESYSSGAFDANNVIAGFSSRGPSTFEGAVKPNIAAPGVSVRSSLPTDSYASKSGTSMASPHTAATVALIWSASPALLGRIAETRALLDQSARDASDIQCGGGAASNNVWGEGTLDAFAAVERSPRDGTGALRGRVTGADSGLPVSGATVRAVGPLDRTTTTDGGGEYLFPALTTGAYDVTAGEFGYHDQTAAVSVSDGGTAVQDFSLAAAPRYAVEGHVRSASGGAIAHATVALPGTPIPPVLTDALGYYSFAGVPAGAYDVRAQPAHGCFADGTRRLILNGDATGFDFSLPDKSDAFGYSCRDEAPGYIEADTVLRLDFDTPIAWIDLPFPFTFYGNTYRSARVCEKGYLSFPGDANCDLFNAELPRFVTRNSILPFWDNVIVDPSASVRTGLVGAAPDRRFLIEWRDVRFPGPGDSRIDFEIVLHEQGDVEMQYRNIADDGGERGDSATIGLENEDGAIALMYSFNQPSIATPEHAVLYHAPPYPALEGTVADINDGRPIARATVRALKDGRVVRTVTSDAEGFYLMKQVPFGDYTIEAGKARYGTGSTVVALSEENATYTRNFALQGARAEADPAGLSFSVPPGGRQTGTLALRNSGGLDLTWMMSEISLPAPAPGSIIKSWMVPVVPHGLGYDGDVWLSVARAFRNHEFTVAGAPTGVSWPVDFGGEWPGDMAYDAGRGLMCQIVEENRDRFWDPPPHVYGIHCWDRASGGLVASILPDDSPWASDQEVGLAYRPDDDSFYVGHGLHDTLFHVAGLSHATPGAVLGQCTLPQIGLFAGLGWNPAFGTIWVAVHHSPFEGLYALDPDSCDLEASLVVFDDRHDLQGLEVDEAGNLWVGEAGMREGYGHLIESGLPNSTDLPWLSEGAVSGALSPAATQAIDVTVDASGLAPGVYTGELVIRTSGARQRNLRVPIDLAVTGQEPFPGHPFAVPGMIQAEDFDRGGEGVAYHDNVPGNAGGLYRPDEDVDIISPYAGGFVVNNFEDGEWLEYVINVPQAGVFRLETLASSEFEGSRWHMEIDGSNVTGPVWIPNTGSWKSFQWTGAGGVSLAAGPHVLRIQAEQEYFNLDALRILP